MHFVCICTENLKCLAQKHANWDTTTDKRAGNQATFVVGHRATIKCCLLENYETEKYKDDKVRLVISSFAKLSLPESGLPCRNKNPLISEEKKPTFCFNIDFLGGSLRNSEQIFY